MRPLLGLFVALALACTTPPATSGAGATPHVSKTAASQIRGGVFEASGATHVPGTNGVLFVDDGTTDAIFWTELDASGTQTGDAVRVALGVDVTDPEGITCDGRSFYVVGSQSKKSKSGAGLVRFTFDPASRTASSVDVIDGLEKRLLSKSTELAKIADGSGINIEGLAWDPRHNRLLLGLRAPMDGDDALVVPVTLAGGEVRVQPLIRLALGGLAVRSIEYDDASRAFLVVAGATDKKARVDFTLWAWNGEGERPSLTPRATIDRDLKPEGVARVGGPLFVACDVGSYVVLDQ